MSTTTAPVAPLVAPSSSLPLSRREHLGGRLAEDPRPLLVREDPAALEDRPRLGVALLLRHPLFLAGSVSEPAAARPSPTARLTGQSLPNMTRSAPNASTSALTHRW